MNATDINRFLHFFQNYMEDEDGKSLKEHANDMGTTYKKMLNFLKGAGPYTLRRNTKYNSDLGGFCCFKKSGKKQVVLKNLRIDVNYINEEMKKEIERKKQWCKNHNMPFDKQTFINFDEYASMLFYRIQLFKGIIKIVKKTKSSVFQNNPTQREFSESDVVFAFNQRYNRKAR